MNNPKEKALTCFQNNFNCSQSVLCALSHRTGLSEDASLKIATAFGTGIARNQLVCGAVTGALMAIGLKHGMGLDSALENKKNTYNIANDFIDEFKVKHKSIVCLDLLGVDMNTPEGQKKFERENLIVTKCGCFVADAAEIAEKYL